MNPLERFDFIRLESHQHMEAETDVGSFTCDVYDYVRKRPFRPWEESRARWILITIRSCTPVLEASAEYNGLLHVNGVPVCVSCKTSEFVRSHARLNGGTATCSRCGSIDKGWGAE